MRRAVRFLGVSNAQSTLSVPADGWQPTQSDPTAADMIPIVSMKSSTVRPFSACTFLNVSSTVGGLLAAAWPACADISRPAPASVAMTMSADAAVSCLDVILIRALLLAWSDALPGRRFLGELIESLTQTAVEFGVLAWIPVG